MIQNSDAPRHTFTAFIFIAGKVLRRNRETSFKTEKISIKPPSLNQANQKPEQSINLATMTKQLQETQKQPTRNFLNPEP